VSVEVKVKVKAKAKAKAKKVLALSNSPPCSHQKILTGPSPWRSTDQRHRCVLK